MAPVSKRRKTAHVKSKDEIASSDRGSLVPETPRKTLKARQALPHTVAERRSAIVATEEVTSDESDTGDANGVSYQSLLQSFGQKQKRASKTSVNLRHGEQLLNENAIFAEEEGSNLDSEVEQGIDGGNFLTQADELDDEDENALDPFLKHFANPDENELSQRIAAITQDNWRYEKLQSVSHWRRGIWLPDISSASTSSITKKPIAFEELHLKRKLHKSAQEFISDGIDEQNQIMSTIFNYVDLLYCARSSQSAGGLRQAVCLHALNHVLKTRDRVIKNTARIAKEQMNIDIELRDQGFTRPKILFLLETRQSCVRYIDTLTHLFSPEQQENKKRFQDAFAQSVNRFPDGKPEDFVELFEGNDDNDFRLGLKFTRKTMKFYSQFYASDIIFASPLGLRRAIKPDDPKNMDYDFLSSIELLVIDQADAMLMQNWEHVEFALEKLNLQPNQSHGCDFSRVRRWYLDQNARYLRQSIVFSAYLTPELNGLFASHMRNVAGKAKTQPTYRGALLTINTPYTVTQTFSRFSSSSPSTDPAARFAQFTAAVLPSLLPTAATPAAGTLLFIPSYLDYTRIRNHLTQGLPAGAAPSFDSITEYTPAPTTARARSRFAAAAVPLLLYTGRAHHFRRFARMAGTRRVIFYGLPPRAECYAEIVGFLSQAGGEVKVLFSRWDGLALERVVGSERVGKMMREEGGDTFEFR